MIVTLYDSTGKITGMMNSDPTTIAHTKDNLPDQKFIEGDYLAQRDTKYVLDSAIADRPVNPAILTGATLSALPVPCKIRINAAIYDCAENTAELAFDHPGTYRITVIAWPHQDKVFTHENPA